MTTKKKIIISIAIILILAVIAYFIFRKKEEIVIEAPVLNPDGIKQTVVGETFPLTSGARGENTKRLQMALNRIKPASPITVDGIFGDETRIKIMTTLSTGMYGQGAKGIEISDSQLNNIIALGNRS